MRKFFLYLLAAIVLTSCDNLKKKSSSDSEDDTEETTKKKKKKALDEDEENMDEEETPKKKKKTSDDDEILVDDGENIDSEDNNEGWTQSDRNKFLNSCVKDAAVNIGEELAKERCDCFLRKVEEKYNSYTDADRRMTKPELNSWAAECQ